MQDAFDPGRRQFILAALGTGVGLAMFGHSGCTSDGGRETMSEGLNALRRATTWINSPPLSAGELRGKVVVVNVCTYTCINWLRSLPYVRAWATKYRGNGLVVVGVHTPEFPFEHDVDNVRHALSAMGVVYPVAVDNDYAVWKGLDNNYWPATYLFDAQGALRDQHFGEGEYDKIEHTIQQLLADTGARDLDRALVRPDAHGIEAPADWAALGTPETYLGSARSERFAGGAAANVRPSFTVPERLGQNEWALDGNWRIGDQAVTLGGTTGRIVMRFHARDVHLVMGPTTRGTSLRFRV
ncbi:MAG TPA: cytochrome c biogenesis protein DipZ, partial [Casimicrobiaceae bacterium]|nr:cytochrome c biogenesis protein DipZ [Casimicrobiaceae bacterium]